MAPVDMFRGLQKYYLRHSDAGKDLPVITTWTAALLSIFFTLVYVIPFYLSPSTRPSPTLNRDAPSVIRARIQAVTLACLISSISALALATYTTKSTNRILESLHLLGWYPVTLSSIFPPLLLTATLFTGPLFEKLFIEGVSFSTVSSTLRSWIGYRNFVAGPITEEILFRSVLIAIHLLAKASPNRIALTTPLYFGIAHVHHFYEFTLTHPHTPWVPILLRSLFQFTYTTLFGWFASFVYLRTGTLYTCILIHAFCNWAGFPRLWGRVERKEAFVGVGPYGPDAKAKQDGTMGLSSRGRGELSIVWTIMYYVLLFSGAYGFYVGFWPLTESENALARFGSGKN